MRGTEKRIIAASMGYFDAVERIIVNHRYELNETREQVAELMSTPFARSVFSMVWPEEPQQ